MIEYEPHEIIKIQNGNVKDLMELIANYETLIKLKNQQLKVVESTLSKANIIIIGLLGTCLVLISLIVKDLL